MNHENESTDSPAKRKQYATYLITLLQTNFPEFKSEILLITKKFNSSSEGFIFSGPKSRNEKIRNFLQKKNLNCHYQGRGEFLLTYPESYTDPKTEAKTLINLCEKERKNVLNILADEKYYAKRGGLGTKNTGVFSVNKSANFAAHRILRINIINKNLDTLKPILKLIKQYYSNHNKKDLVNIEENIHDFTINVKFMPSFFEIPKTTENPEQAVQTVVENEEKHAPDELTVLVEIALEEEEKLSLDMAILQKEKLKNKKELLLSISSLLMDTFWELFKEKNILLFEETVNENGLKRFSQISLEELKEPVSQEVSQRLKLI